MTLIWKRGKQRGRGTQRRSSSISQLTMTSAHPNRLETGDTSNRTTVQPPSSSVRLSSVRISSPVDVPRPPPPPPRSTRIFRVATLNAECHMSPYRLLLIVSWATERLLDVVAITEWGTPTIPPRVLSDSGWRLEAAPQPHAGTALLLRDSLHAIITTRAHHASGRAIAVTLESKSRERKVQRTALVCVYMPTGLEQESIGSDKMNLAEELHRTVLAWTSGCRALVLGDFNETLTPADRHTPREPRARYPRHRNRQPCMHQLLDMNFIDCYRTLHPTGGFTCLVPLSNHGPAHRSHASSARLDYVLARGWQRSDVLAATVEDKSPVGEWPSARHLPLVVHLRGGFIGGKEQENRTPLIVNSGLPLPNMRAVTEAHAVAASSEISRRLSSPRLKSLVRALNRDDCTTATMDTVTDCVLKAARHACTRLPSCAPRPRLRSQHRLRLVSVRRQMQALRSSLTRSLVPGTQLLDSRELDTLCVLVELAQYTLKCKAMQFGNYGNVYDLPSFPPLATITQQQAMEWLCAAIGHFRYLEKGAVSEMLKKRAKQVLAVGAATILRSHADVHRLLRPERGCGPLREVRESKDSALLTDGDGVHTLLRSHFQSIFGTRPRIAERPPWWDVVFAERSDIKSEWYNGLMDPVTESELVAISGESELTKAPGHDGVGAGAWRLLIKYSAEVRSTLLSLFNACLRHAHMPATGHHSIIVPILKDENSPPLLSNIRPISLQPALTKLLSKILARRLGVILGSHPILHPHQRGFIPGRSSHHCVTSLVEAQHTAVTGKRNLFHVFYDVKAAFDCARHDDIVWTLAHLRMPPAYIAWVQSSMHGLTASVRTAHGLSGVINIGRGVPQGGPESPLHFVCKEDHLLWGFERIAALVPFLCPNAPVSAEVIRQCRVPRCPSLSRPLPLAPELEPSPQVSVDTFADDVRTSAGSIAALGLKHRWVEAAYSWSQQTLNTSKTLISAFLGAQGVVTADHPSFSVVKEELNAFGLTFTTEGSSTRYLGSVVDFNAAHCAMKRPVRR